MKKRREWSNSEIRALTRGESMYYYSTGQHYYTKSDWYVWFFGNTTRYSIFHTFLLKYGEGELVSYTDLTRTEKVGAVRLKIDSVKSTIREGLAFGFLCCLHFVHSFPFYQLHFGRICAGFWQYTTFWVRVNKGG